MDADKTVTATFIEVEGVILPKDLIVTPGTVIQGFEFLSGWKVGGTGTGYGMRLDTAHVKEGAASIKMTTPSSGNVIIGKNVTWDLSANQGNFRLWVYVSGNSLPTNGSIKLSTDTQRRITM